MRNEVQNENDELNEIYKRSCSPLGQLSNLNLPLPLAMI
jgi:hypothetical protein